MYSTVYSNITLCHLAGEAGADYKYKFKTRVVSPLQFRRFCTLTHFLSYKYICRAKPGESARMNINTNLGAKYARNLYLTKY